MPKSASPNFEAAIGDDVAMAALRLMALGLTDGRDWSRSDDHVVVALLIEAQHQGKLPGRATAATAMYRLAPLRAAATANTPAQARSPGPRPASTAASATPAPVAPVQDAATMAAVLRSASDGGVPFVEECLADGGAS